MTKPLPVLPHMHGGRGHVDTYAKLPRHIGSKCMSQMHMKMYVTVFLEVVFVSREPIQEKT
jgi:hypothetical protein